MLLVEDRPKPPVAFTVARVIGAFPRVVAGFLVKTLFDTLVAPFNLLNLAPPSIVEKAPDLVGTSGREAYFEELLLSILPTM